MDKVSIEKLEDLAIKANGMVVEAGSKQFINPTLKEVEPKLLPVMPLTTLQGFVDYINHNVDGWVLGQCQIHIKDAQTVHLVKNVENKDREVLASVSLSMGYTPFKFGASYELDTFLIALTALFVNDDNKDNGNHYLRQFASKIVQNSAIETGDDGISQNLTVKKGISGGLKENAQAKPIVSLRPYRTFREVEQPSSQFLFRVKVNSEGSPCCYLYEADGGAWVLEAMANIKKYLVDKLPEMKIVC